jgi:hypothetical protein
MYYYCGQYSANGSKIIQFDNVIQMGFLMSVNRFKKFPLVWISGYPKAKTLPLTEIESYDPSIALLFDQWLYFLGQLRPIFQAQLKLLRILDT